MSLGGPAASAVHGVVVGFDEHEGLGEIELEDGRIVGFHATQLCDGTRRIEVGAPVRAAIVAGHRGRFEAASVTRR